MSKENKSFENIPWQVIKNYLAHSDYPFWQNWLIADCIDQIQAAKAVGNLMAWAAGHNNMIKAIGKRPMQVTDPKLIE